MRENFSSKNINMAGRGTDIVLGGSLWAELNALGKDASEDAKQVVRDDWQKRHEAELHLKSMR